MSDLDDRIALLSPAKRELLLERLGRRLASPAQTAIPRRAEPAGSAPLSSAQQRLWFLDQLEPGAPAYNICRRFTLTGPLRVDVLSACLDELVRRHEALRTRFQLDAHAPVQVIEPPFPLALPMEDLGALPPGERPGRLRALSENEARRPFELERGPLVRARLVRLAEEEHALLLALHHSIADGWSLGVLQRELIALYAARAAGLPPALPEVPIQYADYASWERAGGPAFEEHLGYWRRQLAGAPASLPLPADRPRPSLQSHRGAVHTRTLPPPLTRALRELARREGVTPFMVLLAAFQTLLYRLTGETELVIGTPVANRGRTELEPVVGCVANTLALRTRLSGDLPFRELLRRAQETCLEAFAHQELPFERVVEAVRPERNLAHSPLFQVMLSLAPREPDDVPVAPGLRLRRETVDTGAAAFELSFLLEEGPEELGLDAEYSAELFDAQTIARWVGHFERLLEGIAARPDQRLSRLPLFSDAEHRALLSRWNDTGLEVERGACLHHLVERRAARTPEAIAVEAGGLRLTYRELDERSNRLAHELRRLGVGPDARVGLQLERSVELAIGMLGVLKAGGAYVPLDPGYPAERLAFLQSDARIAVRVTQPGLRELLPGEAPVLCVPSAGERDERPPTTPGLDPEHLAYVMYTSGSTGRPKGVQITHRALAHHAQVMVTQYGLEPGDRVLQFASPSFDVAAEELFPTWCAGATSVLRPPGTDSMAGFTRWVDETGLTVLNLPAPFWHAWLPALAEPGTRFPRSLRLVIAGSEQVAPGDVEQWRALAPPAVRLLAAYGVTETTVTATLHDLDPREPLAPDRPVPIGRPIANTRAYVLNDALEPTPPGAVGELYLGGEGLARGYLHRPELTAERFIPHPFSSRPGARLYRTGDLARSRADGALEFVGRADDQVKVRGYRIEPGEIEAALGQHPGVRECAVTVREDPQGDRRLVAYVVAAPGQPAPSAAALREHLSARLPAHMVPARYVALDALPLAPSGKLDRRALPAPDPLALASSGDFVAPRTPGEELLAGLWAEVLGLERVGLHDDFFALGGHSLLATRVSSRIRELCGVELSVRALFEAPTVAGLAERVGRARREATGAPPPAIAPAPRTGPLPLSFAQERLWFLEQLQPGGAQYAMPYAVRLRGPLDPRVLERCLQELVARHEGLRTTFPLVDGVPTQAIAPALRLPLQVLDRPELPPGTAPVEDFITAEVRRPFDLAAGPLLRASLLRLEETESVLLLSMHHIVADGWSMDVLERELAALYGAFARGEPSPLPAPTLQYADFAVWQRAWLQGEELERQLAFWREQLAGTPVVLELPTDRPRPAVQSFLGELQTRLLPSALRDAIRQLGRREGGTPFMVLLAAFQVLLWRLAGQDDVVVGTPIAGRTRLETEGIVGCFANTLALRARLGDDPPFRTLLGRVRESCLGAYAHQDLPFERLVDALQPERSLSFNPVFQVVFAHHAHARPVALAEGLELLPVEVRTGASKFDLLLATAEVDEGLQLTLEYATALFDPPTIGRMLDRFQTLLEGLVADPGERISRLPLLPATERALLLTEWNRTTTAYPRDQGVHALFELRAALAPEAAAAVLGEARLTYGELDRRSNQLAHHLRTLGVGPEARVGLCLERSLELPVVVLGVLKAGGAYVPLDPDYPQDRLAFMAGDARLQVLLTQRSLAGRLPGYRGARVCLDADWSEIAARPVEAPAPLAGPEHLAYVIYTSGSTGQPKGVLITHAGLTNAITCAARRFGITPTDRMLQAASLSFDASVLELFTALTGGATVVLMPPGAVGSGVETGRLLQAQAVSATLLPPSLLEVLPEEEYPHLRTLIVGGEAATQRTVARWAPGRRLFNAYGPTEVTIYATCHECADPELPTLPLGRPIDNAEVYLLDRHLQPVPLGVPGEIYLGGVGLARGYLHRPELTAERFIPHPFSAEPGARLYRTSDLARYRPDGALEFLGRADHQVKLRGFRIELGELESVLTSHPAVREAVVVLREDSPGVRYLAAYIARSAALDPGQAAEAPRELRRYLQDRLPAYMVPTAIVPLDELPLTPNGKIDRRALPVPGRTGAPATGRVAPRTSAERMLAGVWAEVLGIPAGELGVEDNFFELGGNSLLATRAVSRLRAAHGIELSVRAIFEAPTLAALAEVLIERELEGADATALAQLVAELATNPAPHSLAASTPGPQAHKTGDTP